MSVRPPSAAPGLPGFAHERLLGSGGFADVFLYQQLHPRRQVAVKVLLKERMDAATAQGFTDEANLMAQLAAHPSIVSIYEAGVAGDGRPYLVMEYCSKPNLQVRHRKETLSEAETLRIGVQIAGAVETAHRAGILHRDIKPANILVTSYGKPKLTDFGISGTVTSEASGMSIPWSPPEAVTGGSTGPASDVYSLGATLYTLLANRTPFQIPGAPNGELDVLTRIQSLPLPRTGRPDVSPALEDVLARAMAKNPAERYPSAIDFARALQHVQITLGMQETPIDVEEDDILPADHVDDEEKATRFRGVTSIDAQGTRPAASAPPLAAESVTVRARPDAPSLAPRGAAPTYASAPAYSPAAAPVPPPAPALSETVLREVPPAPTSVADAPAVARRGPRPGVWIAVAAAVVLIGGGVGAALALAPQGVADADSTPQAVTPVDAGPDEAAPEIAGLSGAPADGGIGFTWTNPAPETGDIYLWRPVVPGEEFTYSETSDASAVVPLDATGRACIEVMLRRADGTSADAGVEGCAP